MAGAAFDEIGVAAPYFVGAILAALAVPAAVAASRPKELPGAEGVEAPAGIPEKT
jgi:hypothetical protein